MSDEPISWLTIRLMLLAVLVRWQDDGKTPLYFGVLPTPAVDSACTKWILENLPGLADAPLPPEVLRPWILARAQSAFDLVGILEAEHETPPSEHNGPIYEVFLVEVWDSHLRAAWPGVGRNNVQRRDS